MDYSNGGAREGGGGDPSPMAHPEPLSLLREGISLVLSRWTALQVAIENEWGGRDSCAKADDLAASILSWFLQSKDPLYIDDLENLIDESMVLSFNSEIEDGSVEEVAEQLMVMHEDSLKGNYESIEKLRRTGTQVNAVSRSRRVIDDNEDESSDEEVSKMMVDETKPKEMVVNEPKPSKPIPDEDGWSVVAQRRNRGKRSG
ncbi:pre-rRNA-processing protein TSR2 homolog [Ananas comosus]|uniref:Pre-rRNA-processing protein TSR2 homolog n=1 Tax=Ananas comosus TaxID=4615 RepID=A0A6P5F6D0_ANACO|nr:pre-rRNA-processing protein TSR2 homolog [Ananas comosus]